MQRVTITVDDGLMTEIDALIALRGYQNRSEAIRDLARAGLQQDSLQQDSQQHAGLQHAGRHAPSGRACVAALVYVYDHATRELSKRLANSFHDHHALSVSTLHVHLSHETCLEVTVLKGPVHELRGFAEHVIAQRGVRHGQLVILPDAAAGLHDRDGSS